MLRANGVTPAERYLQRLCDRSFLSLFELPQHFRVQRSSGKGDGKELMRSPGSVRRRRADRLPEDCSGDVRSAEVRPINVHTDEVRFAEVRPLSASTYQRLGLSSSIPAVHPFLKPGELFRIGICSRDIIRFAVRIPAVLGFGLERSVRCANADSQDSIAWTRRLRHTGQLQADCD